MIVKEVKSEISDELNDLDDVVLDEVKEDEKEEEFPFTVEDVVSLSGNLACMVRFDILPAITKKEVDRTYEDKFYERYVSIANKVLKIIGFDDALKTVSIKKLPPEYSLWSGIVILVALAVFIPIGGNVQTIKDIVKEKPKTEQISAKADEKKPEEKPKDVEQVTKENIKNSLDALKTLKEKVRGGDEQ